MGDTHNIVVNQILHVPAGMSTAVETVTQHIDGAGDEGLKKAGSVVSTGIEMLQARQRMQQKYLNQIDELYTDFNVVKMPLLGKEVRGTKALLEFSPNLISPYSPDDATDF